MLCGYVCSSLSPNFLSAQQLTRLIIVLDWPSPSTSTSTGESVYHCTSGVCRSDQLDTRMDRGPSSFAAASRAVLCLPLARTATCSHNASKCAQSNARTVDRHDSCRDCKSFRSNKRDIVSLAAAVGSIDRTCFIIRTRHLENS